VICIPTENSKLAMANSMYEDSRVVGIVKDRSKNGRWAKELTKREVRGERIELLKEITVKAPSLFVKKPLQVIKAVSVVGQ
ncbi:hypothetical protein LCGC14_2703440, partial [marine sediment metagenome]